MAEIKEIIDRSAAELGVTKQEALNIACFWECQECGEYVGIAFYTCPDCGTVQPGC